MYRFDKRAHRHKRAQRRFVSIAVFCSIVGAIYLLMHLRIEPQQEVHNAPSVSRGYVANKATKLSIDKPLFHMELPGGWKEISPVPGPTAPDYSFRSPSQQAQLLDIYMTYIPANMALNKAIVVTGQGNGLGYDLVSDNCTTFTDPSKTNLATKTVQARWQGTDFICDVGNFARAVVGTVSTEGINQVTITGVQAGSRKLFISYTDNNIDPDYSILYAILGSLHFK